MINNNIKKYSKMLLISVIIPSYKPKDYFYECLNSIKNQDISQELYEVIIVLNGCNEPYQGEIEAFINQNFQQKCKITLIQTDIAGVSNARNMGIDVAEGQYIAFVDDDDLLSVNYLSSLIHGCNQNSLTVSNVKVFQNDLNVLNDDYISNCYIKNCSTSSRSIFKLRSFLSSSCAKLISREMIENRKFDIRFTIGEDSLFMFTISDKIKEIRMVDTVYYRRKRTTSASQTPKTLKEKFVITKALLFAFNKIYFNHIFRYRFSLYLSRIVAVLLNLFR